MNLIRYKKDIGKQCALIALIWVFVGVLSACTDDIGYKVEPNPEFDENFTGFTLMLPNIDLAAEFGATRSDSYANTRAYDQAKEGNFNTLYIAAVKFKSNGEEWLPTDFQTYLKTQSIGVEGDYLKYSFSLPEGFYKFYVVSNLNRYLFDDNNNNIRFPNAVNSEEDVRNLIINFTSTTPLEPGFLPMACMHEDLKLNSSTAQPLGKGLIQIQKGDSNKIYADLNYLCAKIRYTILFDRDQSEFGSNDIIDVHRHVSDVPPFATNIRQQTAVKDGFSDKDFFITDNSGDLSRWDLYLDRYKYPSDINFYNDTKKVNGEEIALSPEEIRDILGKMTEWTSADGEWTSETFLKKRAWQGLTYLPENLIEDNPTILAFPYSFNNNIGSSSPRKIELKDFKISRNDNSDSGIRRSMMYDVYIVIKSPDAEQWSLNVIPSEWSLQELAYQLHGPYELIVETTQIETLSMHEDAIFWFRSDVPPEEIKFSSPYVMVDEDGTLDYLFHGEVVKNTDGSFAQNENGDYLFKVSLNVNIPYRILNKLNSEDGFSYGGDDFEKIIYTKKDISFFHIIAGDLHKRIEIKDLDLDPYLLVTPQTIIVDTRELYVSEKDVFQYLIEFETNVDIPSEGVTFTLSDQDGLIKNGSGNGAMTFSLPSYITSNGSSYKINQKTGSIILNIKDIITGNPFWNEKNNEFTLTFTLTLPEGNVLQEKVVIKVRPFSGSYTIHFRDNTKSWAQPHIYIFQDLTLPADMQVMENGNLSPYEYAGKIVGYVEQNPQSGLQWNAAAQYVFTNNLSFKGWHGFNVADRIDGKIEKRNEEIYPDVYGGPSLNDPWEEAQCISGYHNSESEKPETTMGFVMFGSQYQAKGDKERSNDDFWFWNYKYSYTETYQLVPNSQRGDRYNFNVNFNSEHELGKNRWSCYECQNLNGNYNNNKSRFYTGIAMEREEGENEGWWKYTLTGVAQPGRTVIIFANWHEPWAEKNLWFDYRAEDYRWPGDYEAGLPLFDFEDNDGWFQFDGNTTNTNQRFTDDKPSGFIPNYFTSDYRNVKIEIYNPDNIQFNRAELGYKHEILIAQDDGYANYDYHSLNKTINNFDKNGNITSFTLNDLSIPEKYEYLVVRLYTDGSNYREYLLAPKYFLRRGSTYVNIHPLYLKYQSGIKMFVKWSDDIQPNDGYWGSKDKKDQLLFYHPPTGGSNWLNVYWGSNGDWSNSMKAYNFTDRSIGNYKYIDVEVDAKSAPADKADKLQLRLCTADGAGDAKFYKVVKIEDLPQFYYPEGDKYLINWHLLPNP